VLQAAEGSRFAAYAASPSVPAGVGAIVLPDVRGLHSYYCDLALRLAELGVDAIAIDYYGRTAGIGRRTDAFECMPHFERATPSGMLADSLAAAEHLRGTGATRLFAIGFCYGGSNAWRLAAELPGLDGAIGFYGHPHRVADIVPRLRAPLLVIGGGADPGISPGDLEAFTASVRAAGGEAELVVYPDAPHSFFDRSVPGHEAACEDAWRRMITFMGLEVRS